MRRYRDHSDLANPPHVFIEKLGKIVMKDVIGRGCVSGGTPILKGRGWDDGLPERDQSGRGSTIF